jgi:hypothetical protein
MKLDAEGILREKTQTTGTPPGDGKNREELA